MSQEARKMESVADMVTLDLSVGGGDDDPEEKDIVRRRYSQSSSSQATISVKDFLEEDIQGIPTIDGASTPSSSHSPSPSEDAPYSDMISRSNSSEREFTDWTKKFHSLVEEAPLLEATIVSHPELDHGISISKNDAQNKEVYQEKDSEGPGALDKCDWVDLQLLEEGRRFVRRNFFAVFLANLIGIAFLLTVRPIQSLLLRTSSLHRKENSLKRYVKLILYLKKFYENPTILIKSEGDDHGTECHGHSDISSIHTLQRNAAKNFKVYVPPPWEDLKLSLEEQEIYEAVQQDAKQLDDGICTNTKYMPKILFTVNPDVPMSQYDLVVIQYVFFGLIAQFPKAFGIHERCDRRDGNMTGLKGYIHLWAVLGHVFGIEEKYNLCIPANYDPETNQLIFKQVLLYSLRTINETAMRLWRSMTSGSSKYFFFFRTKAMMLFMCKDVAQLDNCKHLYSVMKPMERFCYYFYKIVVNWILWIPPCRVAFNCSLRLSVRICQYFLSRAKKCENKWEAPVSVCVIDPSYFIEAGNNNNITK